MHIIYIEVEKCFSLIDITLNYREILAIDNKNEPFQRLYTPPTPYPYNMT